MSCPTCNNDCNNICNQCPPQEPCECAVKDLSTKCILHDQGNIVDGETIVVPNNTLLSTALQIILNYVMLAINNVEKFFKLKNVGAGSEIYAGDNLLGEKKLRKLNSTSPIITVTQNTDDISFGIDSAQLDAFVEANQNTSSVSNSGVGVALVSAGVTTGDNTNYPVKTLTSGDGSVTIIDNTTTVDLSAVQNPTILQQGTNVTITGTGTLANPFIISSTDTNTVADGSETKINAGTNVSITGLGTIASPYIINSTDTNTPTLLENSLTTTVTGNGNVGSEYQIDVNNLQKTINTFPYTITDADDKHTIFVINGASNVTINVPSGLKDNLACAFIQEGTGTVTFVETGLTVLNFPSGLSKRIKDQNHWALLEKKLGDDIYYLGGSLYAPT